MTMDLKTALEVAERLEKEDCIGSTSLALRAVARAYLEAKSYADSLEETLGTRVGRSG